MSLDTSSHYNSKNAGLGLNLSTTMGSNVPEQTRSSKSPHSSQNFPFASKFANPMFQYPQGFPAPGFFPGLYPAPDFGYLAKTPPLTSQMAPLPPFPLTRSLTPPAAIIKTDKFAFEPENFDTSPSSSDLPPTPSAPKTEEEVIEEEIAEDEFQKNFVDALRKSGRLETAEKVIKARQQQLEERGRSGTPRSDNPRPGHSPGASSSRSSTDGEGRKGEDVPEWFTKAQEEVEREKEDARRKADHFEKQMARFGLGNSKSKDPAQKSLELPPPYDKVDLDKKDQDEPLQKEDDPYSNSTDEESEKKLLIEEEGNEPKKSALDDVLNDVIAQSREMTESRNTDNNKAELDMSRNSMTPNRECLDSSREEEESRDFDEMHMAHVEDAQDDRDLPEERPEVSNISPEHIKMDSFNQQTPPQFYGDLSSRYGLFGKPELGKGDRTNTPRDYPFLRDAEKPDCENSDKERLSIGRDSETEQKSGDRVRPNVFQKPPSQDLDLFRAMGLKSDNEMEDFHRLMAMKARRMMMEDAHNEDRRNEKNPFAMHGLGHLQQLPISLASATSMGVNFQNSMAAMSSMPMGSLATTLTTGLPPSFSSRLMDGRHGDDGAPMFPGLGPESMMPFMLPGDDKDGRKEIFFCHLCSYTDSESRFLVTDFEDDFSSVLQVTAADSFVNRLGTSKFHFNAHMNSHFEHRCPHCDYTSRTEGRLKRHIKDFHIDSNGQQTNVQKTMRNNTPGRPKVYRCKQCEFVANTKVEFWVHARIHIKEEKVLQCPKCPFVTEYKHHLEYHLRNHFGSKPYKCSKCNYSCVNKSMLNSHMKSHTNVYQYRCADCTYATKYCHSLKLHLRKYNHKPATILNSDGSLPMEDSKGQTELMKNRDRGPRTIPRPQVFKRLDMESPLMSGPENGLSRLPGMNGAMVPPMYWPVLNNGMHQLPPPLMPVTNMVPIPSQLDRGLTRMPMDPNMSGANAFKCKLCCFDADDKEGLNKHMLKVHAAENQDLFSAFGITSDSLEDEARHNGNGDESHPRGSPPDAARGALDLSKPMDLSKSPDLSPIPYNRKRRLLEQCLTPQSDVSTPTKQAETEMEMTKPEIATPPRKRSRKGKAFKLDTNTIRMQDDYHSHGLENNEFSRNDDFGYTSDETKEDAQKVQDFSEVHDNLRNLNQAYQQDRYSSSEAMKNPFQSLNALTNSIDLQRAERGDEKSEDRMQNPVYIKSETQSPEPVKSDSPAYNKPESPYKSSESLYKSESPYKMDSPRQPSQNGAMSDNEDSSSGRDASSPEIMCLPNGHNINIKGDFFECQYCEIAFRDCVLYTMHMGYHGYKDAFHCNGCGYQGKDKVDFFLHIARIAHV